MKTAHKIRINPTPEQTEYLKRACGTRRCIYNWGREQWEKQYQAYKEEQETVPEQERKLKPPHALATKNGLIAGPGDLLHCTGRSVRDTRGVFTAVHRSMAGRYQTFTRTGPGPGADFTTGPAHVHVDLFFHTLGKVVVATVMYGSIGAVLSFYFFFRKMTYVQKAGPEVYEVRRWFGFAAPNFLTSIVDTMLASIDTFLLAFFVISNAALNSPTAVIVNSGSPG